MAKRSHEDWASLIKHQPASGLSIKDFCHQQQCCISSFYARKAMMTKTHIQKVEPFVKATISTPTKVVAQPYASQQTINLHHQTGLWTFPDSLPASYLLEMIKGLRSC